MKFLYLSFALCISLAFSSSAQPLESTQHTVLWGIVTPNNDTSYLLGTFHDIGDSYLDKYPPAKKALIRCNAVMLESTTEGNAKKSGYSKEQIAANKQWYQSLSKENFELLDSYMKKAEKGVSAQGAGIGMKEMSEAAIAPQELYAVFLHLAVYDVCHIHFATDEEPLEDYLADWTKYRKKKRMPLIGLETSAGLDTKNLFSIAPPHLIDTICSVAKHPEMYSNDCVLANDYQNLNAFDYSFSTAATAADSSNYLLLHDRNAKWLPQIEGQLKKAKTFIAVGLMHLWYSDGLISLLIADGYKVFPVAMK